MNNPLKLAILCLTLITLTFNSCKKSDSSAPKVSNTIAFKFNSTAYSTSNISASYSKGALQVIGTINNTTNIYLAIPENTKVGTFDLSTGDGASSFISGSADEYLGDTGTITITSFTSTTVSGTFQFNGTDISNGKTCVITNGTFQSNYTVK